MQSKWPTLPHFQKIISIFINSIGDNGLCRKVGKVCVQDRPTFRWDGGRHRGSYSRDAPPVASVFLVGGLVFLLIDTWNTFYEENQATIIWAAWFKWPSGTQFNFNCYRHWDTLVVRDVDKLIHLSHIKEGVNQGGPLTIISYSIGILPLIRELCNAQPHATQLWCVYDAGAGGEFADLQEHIRYMIVCLTPRG